MNHQKEIEIYAYAMTTDSGFAPCVQDHVLTLACCKTALRYKIGKMISEGALDKKEIYVLGVCGKGLLAASGMEKPYYPVFLAKITKAISVSEYYGSSYKERPDQVYCKKDNQWQVKDGSPHQNGNEWKKDIWYRPNTCSKENYVLLSTDYLYLGKKAKDESFPDVFRVLAEEKKAHPRNDLGRVSLTAKQIEKIVDYMNNHPLKNIQTNKDLTINEYFLSSCKNSCSQKKKKKNCSC